MFLLMKKNVVGYKNLRQHKVSALSKYVVCISSITESRESQKICVMTLEQKRRTKENKLGQR